MSLTVYKSSAGSGKTFTLVKQFLELALKSPKPFNVKHILALTFTNKAADEMKTRVTTSLEVFAQAGDDLEENPLFKELLNSKKIKADKAELIKRSKQLHSYILNNYTSLSISTIDAFNYKLIQTFAYDLKVSNNATIELDESHIIEHAVREMLEKSAENQQLNDWLTDFLLIQLEDEKSWNLKYYFENFGKLLLSENAQTPIETLAKFDLSDFLVAKKRITKRLNSLKKKATTIVLQIEEIIEQLNISYDSFWYGNTTLFSHLKSTKSFDWSELPKKRILQLLEQDDWSKAKAPADDKQKIEAVKSELAELIQQSITYIEENRTELVLLNSVQQNLYGIGVLSEIKKEYDNYVSKNEVLPISRFNKYLADVIRNEPAPFIYERLGTKYRHFLIDEFQDTSRLQWYNILPLLENGVSQNFESLLVGDAKQAIYRWRGGDANQLVYLPKIKDKNADPLSVERSNNLSEFIKHEVLTNNWRSQKEIVEFNNFIFKYLAASNDGLIADVYEAVEQTPRKPGAGGYIEYTKSVKTETETIDYLMEERVFESIRKALDAGFSVGDITILCPKNKEVATICNFLKPHYELVTELGLLMFNDLETQLTFTVLKYINHSYYHHEPILQTHLAVEIFVQLAKLNPSEENPHSLLKAAAKNSSPENISFLLNSIGIIIDFEKLIPFNTHQQFMEITRCFHIDLNNNPYVNLLLNTSIEFLNSKPAASRIEYIKYIESKEESLSLDLPESPTAIKVMTVHKAKGLEFPVVIFAYANRQFEIKDSVWIPLETKEFTIPFALVKPSKKFINTAIESIYNEEYEKTKLDTFNLFYVAFTRAESALFIHSYKARSGSILDEIEPILKKMNGYHSEENHLTIGELKNSSTKKEPQQTTPENKIELTYKQENFWFENLKLAPKVTEEVQGMNEREFGNLIHFLLSQLSSSDNWKNQISKLLDAQEIEDEEKTKATSTIKKLFDSPQFTKLFDTSGKRMLERNFVSASGELLRPDCVILSSEKNILIDYKTGNKAEEHKVQIMNYKTAIEALEKKPTEAYLVYTDNIEIVEVA